jgi:hypothetical protein
MDKAEKRAVAEVIKFCRRDRIWLVALPKILRHNKASPIIRGLNNEYRHWLTLPCAAAACGTSATTIPTC